MVEEPFDVVVVGAGAAGVCCAGEFVVQGLRPLLICETPDVGWALRSVIVDGNRGFVQHPIWQIGWGGGWWYTLARQLNAPVQFHVPPPLQLLMRPTGTRQPLYPCASAAAIFSVFAELAPVPIDPLRDEFERVVGEILALPWLQLLELTDTPLAAWLDQHGAAQHLLDLQDELFPGFAKATEATASLTHRHYWLDPLVHGPKLPSTTDAIRGLWFAGDGSTPIGGIGVDGAAGAGVLRARQVARSLRP